MSEAGWLSIGDRVVLKGRYTLNGEPFGAFQRACFGAVGTIVGMANTRESSGTVVDVDWSIPMPAPRNPGRETRGFVDAECLGFYVEEVSQDELIEVYESLGVNAHLKGANAEDCPRCVVLHFEVNLHYPFICPGKDY